MHGKVSDFTGRPSPSFSAALYWILAVCRATGLLWRKTLKTRKDLFLHLDRLHKWITSLDKVLKVIRSDNEFVTAVVTDWLHDKRGIRILPSIPYEHDTVRTVERANQTMDNTITKMLDLPCNKHLSRQHWAMAFTHALKIKNRLPSAALQGQSPISIWQPEVLDPFHSNRTALWWRPISLLTLKTMELAVASSVIT